MQRFEHVVVNQNGTFLPSVSVTVTVAAATPGTGAAASLFSDEGTTSLGTNVVVSDANGRVVFYVADGKYDLNFTGVGITTYMRAALEIADMTGLNFAADKPGLFTIVQIGAADTGLSRLGAASLALGNGVSGDFSGTLKLTILNAVTGIQINAAATTGNVLRGNGTNFVSAQLNYTDLAGSAPAIPGTGQTFNGSTSGSTILKASAVASGTLTLPATTDTLVGKATTDVFTNKTLITATSGNVVTNLAALTFGASAAVVGTGAAATLFTGTVLGSTFAAGKGLKITFWVSHSAGTGSVTYTFNYGGTATNIIISAGTGNIYQTLYFVNNPGSTAAQQLLGTAGLNGTTVVGGPFAVAYAKDTTVNQTLSITFTAAGTEQVTPQAMITEVIQ